MLGLLFSLACKGDESSGPAEDPDAYPWGSASERYAGCSLEIEVYALGERNMAGRYHYAYNEMGLVTEKQYEDIWYADGDVTQWEIRELDEKGRWQTITWKDAAGGPELGIFTYHWDGQALTGYDFTSPASLFPDYRFVVETDAEGRVVSERGDIAPQDGIDDEVQTHAWEDAGRGRGSYADAWLSDEWVSEYADGTRETVLRTYDENGLLLKKTVSGRGDVDFKYDGEAEYEYDEFGRELTSHWECPEPCWKWTEQDNFFFWDCPA